MVLDSDMGNKGSEFQVKALEMDGFFVFFIMPQLVQWSICGESNETSCSQLYLSTAICHFTVPIMLPPRSVKQHALLAMVIIAFRLSIILNYVGCFRI